jgi:hypothetical protein
LVVVDVFSLLNLGIQKLFAWALTKKNRNSKNYYSFFDQKNQSLRNHSSSSDK